MGYLTRGQLKTDLGFLMGNRNDSDFTENSRQNQWCREAYQYMTHPSVHKFRETQDTYVATLATGINEYSLELATVTYQILSVRWVSHILATAYTNTAQKRKLRPKDVRWFMEKTLPSSQPSVYTLEAQNLLISGVPRTNENNQLLYIGVYREMDDFVNDAATTTLPSYFDRPLTKFTQAFAEADLGDRDLSLVSLREGVALLNGAQEETEMEAEDTGWQSDFVMYPPMGPGV